MKSVGLAFFTDTHWTVIGLVLFFSLFLILIGLHLWLYDSEKIQQLSRMPLEESPNE